MNYDGNFGENFIDYNKETWFKEAISREIGFFRWIYSWKENYQTSHWFQFEESVKAHQRLAIERLRPIFEMLELVNL